MSTRRVPRTTRGMIIALLAAALVLMPGLGASMPTVADSAPRLSISSSAGTNKASATGATTVNVSGSGFQSINKGFGGIYVVFGYVKNPTWQPSKGGKAGTDFFYVADSQNKDNKGYQRFVAFPGSSTSDSANGGVINANGTFKLSLVIPGPTFTATNASGGNTTVDCREVQCGIITFGAHGVTNGSNEAFQPVSFGSTAASTSQNKSTRQTNSTTTTTQGTNQTQAPTDQVQGQTQDTGEQPAGQTAPETANAGPLEPVTSGDPTLGLEQQTVIAGRSLGFTGRGFAAGEQVVATLSSGLTAAGPITAGQFGEIAGAVQIPADMTAGTHKIKLTGAGSGNSVETEFSVMADPALLAAADTGNQDGIRWAMIAVIVAAALLFILVLSSLIAALVRKDRKAGKPAARSAKKRPAARTRRRKPARSRAAAKPSAGSAGPALSDEPETSALDRLDESLQRERV